MSNALMTSMISRWFVEAQGAVNVSISILLKHHVQHMLLVMSEKKLQNIQTLGTEILGSFKVAVFLTNVLRNLNKGIGFLHSSLLVHSNESLEV